GSGGAVGGAVVSEGIGLPAKAALAAGIAVATAAGVVFALAGEDAEPAPQAHPAPPRAAAPAVPAPERPSPSASKPPAGTPAPAASTPPASPKPASAAPKPPAPPSPTPSASRSPAPAPPVSATPSSSPRPTPPPEPARSYRLASLGYSALGDHRGPELRAWPSSWVWQRWTIGIADRQYGQGLTVSARSSVEIALNRQCTSFSARAGVDRLSLLSDGKVRFSVWADGKRLWQSAPLGRTDRAAAVEVPLTGHETIRLMVEPLGQGPRPTLASWADAVLTCR
ncbi:RNA polymerase subunit sigma-24, partial [Streptomyces sp. WAC05292]